MTRRRHEWTSRREKRRRDRARKFVVVLSLRVGRRPAITVYEMVQARGLTP